MRCQYQEKSLNFLVHALSAPNCFHISIRMYLLLALADPSAPGYIPWSQLIAGEAS